MEIRAPVKCYYTVSILIRRPIWGTGKCLQLGDIFFVYFEPKTFHEVPIWTASLDIPVRIHGARSAKIPFWYMSIPVQFRMEIQLPWYVCLCRSWWSLCEFSITSFLMAPACFDHHIDPSLCTHRVARLWLSKWQPRCVSTEATKEREGKEQQNLLYTMGRVKKEAVSKRGVKKFENLFNEG